MLAALAFLFVAAAAEQLRGSAQVNSTELGIKVEKSFATILGSAATLQEKVAAQALSSEPMQVDAAGSVQGSCSYQVSRATRDQCHAQYWQSATWLAWGMWGNTCALASSQKCMDDLAFQSAPTMDACWQLAQGSPSACYAGDGSQICVWSSDPSSILLQNAGGCL